MIGLFFGETVFPKLILQSLKRYGALIYVKSEKEIQLIKREYCILFLSEIIITQNSLKILTEYIPKKVFSNVLL